MSALIPLIVVWLLVLIPPAVRSRAERRREFIGSFHRQLGALEASSTSSLAVESAAAGEPPGDRRKRAAQRRRTIVAGLLLSMVVTFVPLLAFPGKLALGVHLAVDNCFLLYVGLLVRRRDALSTARVTPLPPVVPAAREGEPLVLAPRVTAAIPA